MRQGRWCDKVIVWSRSLCHLVCRRRWCRLSLSSSGLSFCAVATIAGENVVGTLTQGFFMEGTMSLELAPPNRPILIHDGIFLRNSVFSPRRAVSKASPHTWHTTRQALPSSFAQLCFLPSSRRFLCKQAVTQSSEHCQLRRLVSPSSHRFTIRKEVAFNGRLQVDDSAINCIARCPAKYKDSLYPPHNISSRLRFPAL